MGKESYKQFALLPIPQTFFLCIMCVTCQIKIRITYIADKMCIRRQMEAGDIHLDFWREPDGFIASNNRPIFMNYDFFVIGSIG